MMGMYTELAINVDLRADIPDDVLALLRAMMDPNRGEVGATTVPERVRDHPLFKTERWWWMLNSGGSTYFDGGTFRELTEPDDFDKQRHFMVWTNIKNYDGEWEHFLDFLAPFIASDEHIGHCRYEESIVPTNLYMTKARKVYWATGKETEDEIEAVIFGQ